MWARNTEIENIQIINKLRCITTEVRGTTNNQGAHSQVLQYISIITPLQQCGICHHVAFLYNN